MDDKTTAKLIGYAVVAIFAYGILQALMPFLIWAVVGLVVFKAFEQYNKHKR